MNKYIVIALIISAIAAIAAYRYYAPVSTNCGCSSCPCEQVVEEGIVVEAPVEEVIITEENHTNGCCGQVYTDEKHEDVK